MINTVLQAIERFETSRSFEETQLPTPIFDNGDENETISLSDTEDETSDDSEDTKDIQAQRSPELVRYQTDQANIKQTLKDKIKIRRESQGAEEFTALFEPPKQYELTPEEQLKNEIRKQRNRRSATKSRQKRIANEKKLEEDADALEKEHAKRKREVDTLKKVKLLFARILQRHLTTCPRLAATHNTQGHSGISLPDTAFNSNLGASTSCSDEKTTADTKPTHNVQNQLPLLQYTGTARRLEEPQTMQHMHQSAQLNLPMKRKGTEELNAQTFKKPAPWNPKQMTHVNSKPMATASHPCTETCTDNNFSEMWTRNTYTATSEIDTCNAVHSDATVTRTSVHCNENILCEIPVTNGNIQPPFLSPGRTNSLGVPTSLPNSAIEFDGIGGNKNLNGQSVSTNATEQQKINQIKQHLFDDFPMQSSR